MIKTVITINSDTMGSSWYKRKQTRNYKKELEGIISQVGAVKNKLADLTLAMEEDDIDTGEMDEALDALDDAIDILEDSLEEEE